MKFGSLGDCSDWTERVRGIGSSRGSLHVGDGIGLAASPAWTAIPSPGATLLAEEALLGGGGSEPTIYELEKCSRWGVTAVASYGKPVADVWLQ